jgi:hypothetical protein
MKPNALDTAVVAVLCCCTDAWFVGLGGASAGVHEHGCGGYGPGDRAVASRTVAT